MLQHVASLVPQESLHPLPPALSSSPAHSSSQLLQQPPLLVDDNWLLNYYTFAINKSNLDNKKF